MKIKKGAVLGRAQTTNTSNDCANAIFRRELRCGRAAFGWFHLRVFPLHLIYTSRPDYTLSGCGSCSPSAKSESQLRNISSGRPAAVVVFAALKIISPLCVVGPAATYTHETQHGQRWCPGGGQMNPLSLLPLLAKTMRREKEREHRQHFSAAQCEFVLGSQGVPTRSG